MSISILRDVVDKGKLLLVRSSKWRMLKILTVELVNNVPFSLLAHPVGARVLCPGDQ